MAITIAAVTPQIHRNKINQNIDRKRIAAHKKKETKVEKTMQMNVNAEQRARRAPKKNERKKKSLQQRYTICNSNGLLFIFV